MAVLAVLAVLFLNGWASRNLERSSSWTGAAAPYCIAAIGDRREARMAG